MRFISVLRFDDKAEFVITVGKNLVAFLRAGKCRDVATNAALRAVYANFNHSAVFEFVRMSCLFGLRRQLHFRLYG